MTTNGTLLTVDRLDKFFKLGLDNININDYRGDRDKYPENGQSILNLSTLHIGTILRCLSKRRTDEVYQTMPVTYRKSLILVTSVLQLSIP